MSLERFGLEKLDYQTSRQQSNARSLGVSHGGPDSSVCETCSWSGTSRQLGAHRTIHQKTARYEIRRLLPDGFVLEDVYNTLERSVIRARGREDLGFFYQVYDRLDKKVVFGD